MARTYTWVRGVQLAGFSPNNRVRFFTGTYPPGSTLERVIFSFALWQDCVEGSPQAPPRKTVQLWGLTVQPFNTPNIDTDPGQDPSRDWLWAGLVSAEILPLRWTGPHEYRVQFKSDNGQFGTESRRRNDSGGGNRVWLVSDALPGLESGRSLWEGVGWISLLYSQSS